jgi:hypothetical protein
MPFMIRMHVKKIGLVTGLSLVVLGGACSSSQKTPDPKGVTPSLDISSRKISDPVLERAHECPFSKKTLKERPATRRFGGHDIHFYSEAEASAFDELPGEEKRVVAGRQVLARKGVANELCIVTRKPLPIDAELIVIEGVTLGFTSARYTNQYKAIPEEVRSDLVGPYLVRASGISNTICPITGDTLHVGCPTVTSGDVRIGFATASALKSFHLLEADDRNEITAVVVLPARGIQNTHCPMTSKPLRLDSPVFEVDGRLIAVRNIKAARAFNELDPTQQRDALQE